MQEPRRHKQRGSDQQQATPALEPWRSVAIEDSKWGLMSARGADLRLVAVSTTYPAHELRSEAELVCGGLAELTLQQLDDLVSD